MEIGTSNRLVFNPWQTAFFFDLLPMLAKKGRVRVSMIRVDDEPIAWEVDLLDKKFMGVHNLSYDQRWKKFSLADN